MNSKMTFYILKRILLAILTVWIVITVTFFVMHAIPGGPFVSEKAISKEAQAALEAKYGLDKPLFEQYTTYLSDIVTKFDFGPSLKQRGRQVIDIIADGRPLTICDRTRHGVNRSSTFEDDIVRHGCRSSLTIFVNIRNRTCNRLVQILRRYPSWIRWRCWPRWSAWVVWINWVTWRTWFLRIRWA